MRSLWLRIQARVLQKKISRIYSSGFTGAKNASPDSVGIGLAMARTILRAQGGEISVRSSPGQGSIFSLKVFNQAP